MDSGRSPSRRCMASWRSRRSNPGRTAALPPHLVQANPGCSWRKNWTWSGQPSPVLCVHSGFVSRKTTPKTLKVNRSEEEGKPLHFTRCPNSSSETSVCSAAQCLHKQHSTGCKHKAPALIKPPPPPGTWMAGVLSPNDGRCGTRKTRQQWAKETLVIITDSSRIVKLGNR